MHAVTRETSATAGGSGAGEVGWARYRPVVVSRMETLCQPADDTERFVEGEVMRCRTGVFGAELDIDAKMRRRPVTGMVEIGEPAGEVTGAGVNIGVGGYWRDGPAGGVGEAGEAEEPGVVCPVGRMVLRRVGPSGAPGRR